ncbi:MAG: alpha/beta fold hydrolase [Hyphomonadaceae bacterium]|nr:alpha/beta fold hydrolase [Hyphomonadaceae bacterium]
MIEAEVRVDGGALSYALAGAGPAIVLLHGWTLDRRLWSPQIDALAGDFKIVAPDRRGFGRSSAPPDLAREADDVARLLDAVDAEQAVIVGMSQAGRVALDVAARFPQRIRALVLQGAPFDGARPGPDAEEAIPLDLYAGLVRAGRLSAMKAHWAQHPLMRTMTPAAGVCAAAMLADYDGRDLIGAPPARREEAAPDSIAAPTLVITGLLDTPWRRRAGDALAAALPDATRREIPAAGHLCNLCAPADYNAALRQFLATVG